MGDILKAISNDIDEYMELCQRFGEAVQHKDDSPDCYGTHAKSLKKRARDEDEARRTAEIGPSPEYRVVRGMLIALLGRIEDKGLNDLIHADRDLRPWWSLNRKEYDAEKARLAAEEKRQRLARRAMRKLNSNERKALHLD